MNNIVDITKKYTTRGGREVVIFEVSDKIYCKVKLVRGVSKEWCIAQRRLDGRAFSSQDSDLDLIPVKMWRAWKKGEVPKFFMTQHKASRGKRVACSDADASTMELSHLFANYDWLHEDGTTTPCGVLE